MATTATARNAGTGMGMPERNGAFWHVQVRRLGGSLCYNRTPSSSATPLSRLEAANIRVVWLVLELLVAETNSVVRAVSGTSPPSLSWYSSLPFIFGFTRVLAVPQLLLSLSLFR
jgi:hypothetical protein